MSDRYHRAARDGRLDLLKEAFTKELNLPDEDGMTPTLWAAYYGNLEALQLCCSRRGNPNKCDYTGNSALHLAAQKGHFDCLVFLVKLGANLWTLDNDFQTPLMIAGKHNHDQCVRYLDEIMNKKKSESRKQVQKKEKEAKKEADERIKKFIKLQEKQQRKMEKNEARRRESTVQQNGSSRSRKISTISQAPTYSQATQVEAARPNFFTHRVGAADSDFLIMTDGRNADTAETVRGVPSEQLPSVMYKSSAQMKEDDRPSPGKRAPIHSVFPDAEVQPSNDIPWFGSRAFRGNFGMAKALNSVLPSDSLPESEEAVQPSFSKQDFNQTEDVDEIPSDEEEEEEEQIDPLVTFLESLKLLDYLPLLQDNKVDMDALELCTDDDLKVIGVDFGPRLKISNAIKTRMQESNTELTTL